MPSEPVLLDLNDLASGKVELASFQQKLNSLDLSPYRSRHVQLAGCAPTWAHLLVSAKLLPIVDQLDFLLDDGKEGKAIPIFKKP
jgi:hypothetical protein